MFLSHAKEQRSFSLEDNSIASPENNCIASWYVASRLKREDKAAANNVCVLDLIVED